MGYPLGEGVKILLIAMGGIFGLEWILNADWSMFGIVPALVLRGHVYQLVTYMFLHGGFMHLLLNAMGLFFFGPTLEMRWGTGKFLLFFFASGIVGGLTATLLSPDSLVPIIGASGSIYGILAANAILYPDAIVYLYMIIPVKAKWLVIGLAAMEFLGLWRGGGNTSHEAHLGGLFAGTIFVLATERYFGYRIKQWFRKRSYEREAAQREREWERTNALRSEVDELLDKINREGKDALSPSERKRLDDASRKLRGE
ncbi:MAG: rhomboid family intramembrane serine protease [bacterium]|nr:rhomboid family intramembrane serine protease [bacterium]